MSKHYLNFSEKPLLKSGFSLMEMMIVLLIVAIIAAATAPMVTKKMMRNAGSGDSPWIFLGLGNDIAYNLRGRNNDCAIIGSDNAPTPKPKLYIQSAAGDPQISFGTGSSNSVLPFSVDTSGNNILLSNASANNNSVLIGTAQTVTNNNSGNITLIGDASQANESATAIGASAIADSKCSIAIGYNSLATAQTIKDSSGNIFSDTNWTKDNNSNNGYCLAIGTESRARQDRSIAIGDAAKALASYSISLGHNSWANNRNAIAIGPTSYAMSESNYGISIGSGASTSKENAIAIGHAAFSQGVGSIAIGARDSGSISTASATSEKAIAIGENTVANGFGSVAIGSGATGKDYTTAVGFQSTASGTQAAALGYKSTASGAASVAVGRIATASASNSIAIGNQAKAEGMNCVAIGASTQIPSTVSNQIRLGTANETVYIPGNLVIGKKAYIGSDISVATSRTPLVLKFDQGLKEVIHRASSPFELKVGDTESSPLSDRRLKNVGDEFKGGLEDLKKLPLYHYTFKKDEAKTPRVGVMAQDLQKVFPNAVTKDENGYLRIRFEDMFYALINAVKELDKKLSEVIEGLKNNVEDVIELKTTVKNQQKLIEDLQKQNNDLIQRIEKLEKSKK